MTTIVLVLEPIILKAGSNIWQSLINPWQNQCKWLCFNADKIYRRCLRENADHALHLVGLNGSAFNVPGSKKPASSDQRVRAFI